MYTITQGNDTYSLKADSYCWTLYKLVIVKDVKAKNYGKEQERVIGYYPTIMQAIRGLVDHSMRTSYTDNLLDRLAQIEKTLVTKLNTESEVVRA